LCQAFVKKTQWFSIFNNFQQISINISLFSTRAFANVYFVLNINHRYDDVEDVHVDDDDVNLQTSPTSLHIFLQCTSPNFIHGSHTSTTLRDKHTKFLNCTSTQCNDNTLTTHYYDYEPSWAYRLPYLIIQILPFTSSSMWINIA
jgi:hypothetical protein